MKSIFDSKRNCFFLVWATFLLLGCGRENAPSTSDLSPRNRGVINGVASPLDSITVRQVLGDGKSCTGTLVGPGTLLTAAHCVLPRDATVVDAEGDYLVSTFTTDWKCHVPSVHQGKSPGHVFSKGPDLALCYYFRGAFPVTYETVSLSPLPASSALDIYGYGLRGIFSTEFGNGLVFASFLQVTMTPLILQKGTITVSRDFINPKDSMYRNDFASAETTEVPIPTANGSLINCTKALLEVSRRTNYAGTHLGKGDSGGPAFLKANNRRTVRGVGHGNSYFEQKCVSITGEERKVPISVAQDYFVSLSTDDAQAFFQKWVAMPNHKICGVNGYAGSGCR